jgi:hypothetical protein
VTSLRKLFTNRQNSLRSTGPKTGAGRARAAGNARRHGLQIAKDLSDFGREFTVIDNYECRALSRRKFAIRTFDEACAADRNKTVTP